MQDVFVAFSNLDLERFDTPCVVINRGTVARNIERGVRLATDQDVGIRPHTKTHKSSAIALDQLAAGAVGLTCATLSEAVALVDAGIRTSLFIAAPFYPSSAKLNRAEYVAERSDVLLIAVDNPHIAEHLGEAMASHRSRVEVLIEVDSGLHRSGVAAESVADVARASSLKVSGVFTHGGHGYPPGRARQAASDEVDALARASEILSNEGFDFDVVSAGSTPTAPYCGRPPVTEIRPGTYVYGDWQMVQNGVVTPEDVALAVATTVISVSRTDNRFVVDAGAKILTKDSPDWVRGYGHIPELSQSTIERVYDNHGVVSLEHGPLPAVGEKLIVIPNHVCPMVNLVDFALVVDAEGSVSEMAIDLRGCLR